MMTEDYNGICPKCGFDRMLVRYGSIGYFHYDGCTKCGFAYGTNHYDSEAKGQEVWDILLVEMKNVLTKKGFPLTRQGLHKYVMALPEQKERINSVFKYDKKDLEDKHLCPDCQKSENNICDKHADEWFEIQRKKNG